jgi:hypothetical protein
MLKRIQAVSEYASLFCFRVLTWDGEVAIGG